MGNITDYVQKYGNASFAERPFSPEDALVLCRVSYFKFDGIVEKASENSVALTKLNDSKIKETMFEGLRDAKYDRVLFDAMVKSKRFSNIKLCMYVNRIEEENETQFSAVTFICSPKDILVVFRGTDESIVGWQEDLGLALKRPITGQKLSAKYINDVSGRLAGNFMVAGHSKGGNLAVYSSMMANENARSRISTVFCFDGPGFRKEFLEDNGYEKIEDRVIKIVPQSSLVGMILENRESRVVRARGLGIGQHNPYSWVIKDGSFTDEKLSDQHRASIAILNNWILSHSEAELERFNDFLDGMLEASDAKTTTEFSKEMIKNSVSVIKAAGDIDDDTKHFLSLFVKSYFELAKETFRLRLKSKINDVLNEIDKLAN